MFFKYYYADTAFIHGKNLPESVCEALNELHYAFSDGVKPSVTFDSDGSLSIRYDVDMGSLRADILQERAKRVLNALRVLFSLDAPSWARYRTENRMNGAHSCRTRTLNCPEMNLAIHIGLYY